MRLVRTLALAGAVAVTVGLGAAPAMADMHVKDVKPAALCLRNVTYNKHMGTNTLHVYFQITIKKNTCNQKIRSAAHCHYSSPLPHFGWHYGDVIRRRGTTSHAACGFGANHISTGGYQYQRWIAAKPGNPAHWGNWIFKFKYKWHPLDPGVKPASVKPHPIQLLSKIVPNKACVVRVKYDASVIHQNMIVKLTHICPNQAVAAAVQCRYMFPHGPTKLFWERGPSRTTVGKTSTKSCSAKPGNPPHTVSKYSIDEAKRVNGKLHWEHNIRQPNVRVIGRTGAIILN